MQERLEQQEKPEYSEYIFIARTNFVFEDRQFFENEELNYPKEKLLGLLRKGMISEIEVIPGMELIQAKPSVECPKETCIQQKLENSDDFGVTPDGDFIQAVMESIKVEKPSRKSKSPRNVKKVEIDLGDTSLIEEADKISTGKTRTPKAPRKTKTGG